MDRIRVRYSKTGKAKYISHLDLMTAMQRAFIRAGASLKYSEGFNPHPYISVALPASVGVESLCELMDVALLGGSIPDKVNSCLPDGLKVLRAYRAFRGFKDIKWVDAQCRLWYDNACPQDIAIAIEERFSRESLLIAKKTKRGLSEIDIAPHVREAKISCHGCGINNYIEIRAKISAQNPTVSHKDIACIIGTADVDGDIPAPVNIEIKRIDIYDANMILFK